MFGSGVCTHRSLAGAEEISLVCEGHSRQPALERASAIDYQHWRCKERLNRYSVGLFHDWGETAYRLFTN